MADIQVFDSKNPDRLLGTLKVDQVIRGDYYSVTLLPSGRSIGAMVHSMGRDVQLEVTKITFRIEWTRRTMAESQFMRTIEEKAHMTTSVPLADLMKLDSFRLPEETHGEANRRRSDFY